MEQGNEDGQADGGLRRGDGHHEKDEDQSVELMKLPGVGDESQVHRVHHQLNGHEDGDAVLAGQHAADADGEQDGAQDQEPVRRDHDCVALRPLRIKAPTMAASSRMETASKGKTYSWKRLTPTRRASERNGVEGALSTAYLAM